jgi:hypothetical protein
MLERSVPTQASCPLAVGLVVALTGLALSSHAGAAGILAGESFASGPARPAPTDYNAYTLEPGEFEVGLDVAVGVLPRVQVATSPLLHAISAPNMQVKWNAFRLGPVDLTLDGRGAWIQQPDFSARWLAPRLQASLTPNSPLSAHAGLSWDRVQTDGIVDLDALSPLMEGQLDTTLDAVATLVDPDLVTCTFSSLRAQGALQLQLSRGHSLIAQGSTMLSSSVDLPIEIPAGQDIPGIGDASEYLEPGAVHMASVGWQLDTRHAALQIGVGTSTIPLMWLTQAVRLSFRFGGGDDADRSALLASRALVRRESDSALASVHGTM